MVNMTKPTVSAISLIYVISSMLNFILSLFFSFVKIIKNKATKPKTIAKVNGP